MLLVQVAGEDPVDADFLGDLVDSTADELKSHGLHDEHLNSCLGDVAAVHDSLESDAALILILLEDVLQEGNHAHLLFQVGHLLHDFGEFRSVFCVLLHGRLEFFDLTKAKGLEQVEKPLEFSSDQTLEDFLIQLFTTYN